MIAAALMQSGLQAVLAAAEIGQIHLFQCHPELCLVRVRLCHAQVALHRALEDGGVVGHQRQGSQTLFLLQDVYKRQILLCCVPLIPMSIVAVQKFAKMDMGISEMCIRDSWMPALRNAERRAAGQTTECRQRPCPRSSPGLQAPAHALSLIHI